MKQKFDIITSTQTAKDIFGEKATQDAKLLIWEIG